MNDQNNNPTVQDPGWRNEQNTTSNATVQDPGWRNEQNATSNATVQDPGWRNGQNADSNATVQDPGWRGRLSDIAGVAEGSGESVANYFKTIEEFKNTVEKIESVRSSTGKVYKVKSTISKKGGEALVLLCTDPDGNDVVAKIYYDPINGNVFSRSARSFVLDYMATDEGQRYTLAVSDVGTVDDFGKSKYYFEIMPYCPGADLSGAGALSFDHLVRITEQLNEILHSIHKANIIHRDIKPDNLYEIDGQLKLGDFGIARNVVGSGVTSHIAGTEGYAAPETRRYVIRNANDYYSMGITLATLYEGKFIFEKMKYEMQVQSQDDENLPISRICPHRDQLDNLFNGLCRVDHKVRFGYEDVKKWLADHDYTGVVRYDEGEWPMPFRPTATEIYRDERSTFEGLTQDEAHWENAKRMLYSKKFEDFFGSFRTDLSMAANFAEEQYRNGNNDKGLAVFLKALYPRGPIVWRGYTFKSLSELADRIMDSKNPAAYAEIFENTCISHWLENTVGIDFEAETLNVVKGIELLSLENPEAACLWFANSFGTNRRLVICGREVTCVSELNEALFTSAEKFYQGDGYDKLSDLNEGAALYGFLYSLGFKELIDMAWDKTKGKDEYEKAIVLFSMMDNIALKSESDPAVVRSFFVNYGPLGISTYTRMLVMKGSSVYMALDAEGRRILSEISGFAPPSATNIDVMYKAYIPLVDSVFKLQRNIVDNPHLILSGVYDTKGVICCNLMGCFAFSIFDRLAPIGFNAWLESANGGKQ